MTTGKKQQHTTNERHDYHDKEVTSEVDLWTISYHVDRKTCLTGTRELTKSRSYTLRPQPDQTLKNVGHCKQQCHPIHCHMRVSCDKSSGSPIVLHV